jgi:hypothetical protein
MMPVSPTLKAAIPLGKPGIAAFAFSRSVIPLQSFGSCSVLRMARVALPWNCGMLATTAFGAPHPREMLAHLVDSQGTSRAGGVYA